MPNFVATFQEVSPILSNTFSASALFRACLDTFYLSNPALKRLIDQTPAPMPISMNPALILEAIVAQLYSPDEQNLFMLTIVVVSGQPAKNIAILAVISPEPGCKQLPTAMSCTSLGSNPVFQVIPFSTADKRTSGGVSLRRPLLALVIGVLRAQQITTSSAEAMLQSFKWAAILLILFMLYNLEINSARILVELKAIKDAGTVRHKSLQDNREIWLLSPTLGFILLLNRLAKAKLMLPQRQKCCKNMLTSLNSSAQR